MSSFARNQCSLHKREFDSFCFTHHKPCCSICHAKMSAACDILCTEQAESRLRDEIRSAAQTMDDVMQKIVKEQKVISDKRRDFDQVESDNLASVKSFYDASREAVTHSEDRTYRAIKARTADQHETLREVEEQANNMVEAMQQIKTSIEQTGPCETGDQERNNNNNILSELYQQQVDILETAGCGEHVITSVSEINVKNPDVSLKFAGCLNDIAKITCILDGCGVSACAQEGAAVSNTSAPTKHNISQFYKVKEFTEKNLAETFSGKIVAIDKLDAIIHTASGKPTRIAEAGKCGYGKEKVDQDYNFTDQIIAMTYVSHVDKSDILMLTKDNMFVRMDSGGHLVYGTMRPGSKSNYMIHVPVIRVRQEYVFVSSETGIICYELKFDHFQQLYKVSTEKAVHSFDLLAATYIKFPAIVVYDETLRVIKSIDRHNADIHVSRFAFGEYTVTNIVVPPAEDRVIFMACLKNLRVKVAILSNDLKQLMKTLEWIDVSPVGACIHRSGIYVSNGDLSNVKHYDTDGNYEETLLTGFQQINGITYNRKSKHMAVLSHPSSSSYNIVVYQRKV